MGIQVLPPDVNVSGAGFSVDDHSIRFGLAGIKSVGDAAIENILEARKKGGSFESLTDFCQRVNSNGLNKR
jgi:DNA polymerase-3 subunit alpha